MSAERRLAEVPGWALVGPMSAMCGRHRLVWVLLGDTQAGRWADDTNIIGSLLVAGLQLTAMRH